MIKESLARGGYLSAMEGGAPHIRLYLDNAEPIALSDFVASFVGVGNQFEKLVARDFPMMKAEGEFYVKDVMHGSIIADLVTSAGGVGGFLATTADNLQRAQALIQFVRTLQTRLSPYFKPGGRADDVSKADLADFHKTVAAIANDPNGSQRIEAAVFEDGKRHVRAAFKFSTVEAREAERQIEAHKLELEASTAADHSRVIMRFVRPSIEPAKTHKHTGQRAIIESIHPKPLGVMYASDLAKDRITHELKEAEGNIFHLLFDVDVNVELSAGKPVAYRIMAVHDVADVQDD